MAFYPLENTFHGIPIPVSIMEKVQPKFEQSSLEPGRAIDEKLGIVDVMFLLKFVEKQCDDDSRTDRSPPVTGPQDAPERGSKLAQPTSGG